MTGQCIGNKVLAVGDAQLFQVAGVEPQHSHRAPVEPGPDHQPVKAVIFRLTLPYHPQRILKAALHCGDIHVHIQGESEPEILQPDLPARLRFNQVGVLHHHPETEILQHGNHIRQFQRRIQVKQFQLQVVVIFAVEIIKGDCQFTTVLQLIDQ